MTESSAAAPAPPVLFAHDPFLHNRIFFARARAAAYERSRLRFRQTQALLTGGAPPGREFLRALDALLAELETVREYSADAVRGLIRRRVPRFRHDRKRGVLEEEIVLLYFSQEMETQARFLRMRVETDLRIRVYRERIRRIRKAQARDPDGRGHLPPGILDSLGGLAEAEIGDFAHILDLMARRFEVGDRLVQVLRDKMRVEADEERGKVPKNVP